jgi:dipeptidyl aminopeptidase/acylaminoacyl peptidase
VLVAGAQDRAPQAQATTKRAFQPQDWYRLKTLSSPVMTSDGAFVAVQVQSVLEAENKRINEIWVASTATGAGEPTRFSAPGYDSTSPRFSPDGKLLIFTSTRPGHSNTQWAVRMDGPGGEFPYVGPPSDTDGPPQGGGRQGGPGGQGPSTPSEPADKSFTVTTGRAPGAATDSNQGRQGGAGRGGRGDAADRTGPMARPPANAITAPLDQRRFDGMHITDLRYKANGRGFVPSTGRGNTENDQPTTQILIDRKDGAGRKALTDTAYSHRGAQVSPDGKWIAFVADAELRADDDLRKQREAIAKLGPNERLDATRKIQTDLYLLAPTGGTPVRISVPGNESNLEWSPDSRSIALTTNHGQFTTTEVLIVDVATKSHKSLTSEMRADPGAFDWLPNNELLLQATVGGRNALYRVNPKTSARTELMGGARRVAGMAFDSAKSKAAFVATTSDLPTELFLRDLASGAERQLSHFNKAVNDEIAWASHERFTYKSVKDFEIEGWLLKPHGYEPGRKYPLVLYIHGGPHSAYNEGWFDEFQNLAGAGMWVLFTNPRGSSGYGGKFTYSTRERWGLEDYEDLMKAVDIAAARPDVDATRLGVTGGSYGGFMTAWITTKTTRFKAAQADRMISNWISWYGISDSQALTEGEFGGNPWEKWDLYNELSPIKYANKVKTPTLIVQSEEDHRTPMADAEQWFMALQKHDVPVEFVRYPRSNHDLSRTGEPWLLTDRLHRIRTWFSYWLKDERATPTTTPPGNAGRR